MDAYFDAALVEQRRADRVLAATAWRTRRSARRPGSVAHVVAAAVQMTARRAAGGCHSAAAAARVAG